MLRVNAETARRLGVKAENLAPRRRRLPRGPAPLSHLVEGLKLELRAERCPVPEEEVVFHEGERRWRFDLAWPALLIAVECEGGTWKKGGGRHNRGKGYEMDCEKHNEANLAGWMLLRFTLAMIRDGRAIAAVKRALQIRGAG
jgi:hypothetical protein